MYGLVLQGGGAKGSYQMGVWKALRELNIDIGAVTGTSIGAMNGALIVQGKFEETMDMWLNIDVNQVFYADTTVYNDLLNLDINFENLDKYYAYFKKVIQDGGLDITPLRNLLEKHVDEKAIRESGIEFGLVTISLTDMKPMEVFLEDIPKGKLRDYLMASGYLPGFKQEELDGKKFVDGGIYDNLPINLMIKKGYTDIITIELDSVGIKRPIKEKDLNVIRIKPSGDLGMMLEFDKERVKQNIDMGYYDTLRVFGKCFGKQYYIKNLQPESYFIDFMLRLESESIEQMGKTLGLRNKNPRRMLFEDIMPEIARMFSISESESYADIITGLLEHLAAALHIERLQIYDYEQFESMVIQRIIGLNDETGFKWNWPDFMRRTNFIKSQLKTDLLIEWSKIIVKSQKFQN